MPKHLILLFAAISCEVVGTMALQASQQFTKIVPSVVVVVGYALSFYFLAMVLKVVPVGVAYAIWSGLGVFLITVLGCIIFGQKLDIAAILGLTLIVAGVVVLQLFSETSTHG